MGVTGIYGNRTLKIYIKKNRVRRCK